MGLHKSFFEISRSKNGQKIPQMVCCTEISQLGQVDWPHIEKIRNIE